MFSYFIGIFSADCLAFLSNAFSILSDFGKYYNFHDILKSKNLIKAFQSSVPIHTYEKIYNEWWRHHLSGNKNVTWHGKTKYVALSSGTSEGSSKYIPVTKDMLNAMRKTGRRQLFSLAQNGMAKNLFGKDVLILSGSSDLWNMGNYSQGDISGICASKIPLWLSIYCKPNRKIIKERSWDIKIDKIVKSANKWDVGVVCGVPAWVQIVFERIIEHYEVNTIHDIWKDLQVYIWGGVSFAPYKKGFEKLLGKPLIYKETYLASEGYIAYQSGKNKNAMELVLDNGLFYEFIPFNGDNFDKQGELKSNPEVLLLNEIEENRQYAILLSSCAGAWRYLIGDTIKFTDLENYELVITGRTKHFLSLCGEHLSIDNMNKAIELVSKQLDIDIREYTVCGIPYQNLFAHKWYMGTDSKVDNTILKKCLDEKLKLLNDDYRTERGFALKEVFVEVVSPETFYKWMKSINREGSQNKVPRIMKEERFRKFEMFVKNCLK